MSAPDKAALVRKLDDVIEWDRMQRAGHTMTWHPSVSIDEYRAMRDLLGSPLKLSESILIVKYIGALGMHDWRFEHSDDQGAFRRGAASLEALLAMQAEVDPSFEIWNTCAPEAFRRTQG